MRMQPPKDLMDWTPFPVPPCQLAESPRYSHGTWAWVDISGRMFYTRKQGLLRTLPLPDEIGCVLPCAIPQHYIALGREGIWKIENQTIEHIQAAPFDSKTHRFNDGRADGKGRIWVSTLVDAREPASANLYCIENGRAEIKVSGLIVGNGLAFSPDYSHMYLADTRQRCIWRYVFDCETGKLGARELQYQYTEGTERPDGGTCTADGSYWVAVYEGHRLDRFAPDGTLAEHIPLPVARPTMPCFGGNTLGELLVCSAKPDSKHTNQSEFAHTSLIIAQTRWKLMPENFARLDNQSD
jgi:sugar lactone lactonase YvrE